MKRFCRCFTLTLAASLATFAQGQRPRVQSQYDKAADATEVAAHVLHLLNTPEQFVQLQLRGQYWGRQLLFPAEEVKLEFYSFAVDKKYRNERDRRIVAVVDGQAFDLSPPAYESAEGDRAIKMLPKIARVGGKLAVEFVSVAVEPEQLALLAGARNVEMRLGATRLPLDEVHRSIMREFVSHIVPPEGVTPEPGSGVEAVAPQLPPELKDASLDATMRWLQDKLDKHGTISKRGHITRLTPVEFSGCRIMYRVTPLPVRLPTWDDSAFRSHPVSFEYRVNLSDLSPESIRAIIYKDSAYLYFRARGGELKIKRGWSHLTDDHSVLHSGASMTLGKSKALTGIVAALTRAVNLCQPKL